MPIDLVEELARTIAKASAIEEYGCSEVEADYWVENNWRDRVPIARAVLARLTELGYVIVEKDALEKAHEEGVSHGWELAGDASSED